MYQPILRLLSKFKSWNYKNEICLLSIMSAFTHLLLSLLSVLGRCFPYAIFHAFSATVFYILYRKSDVLEFRVMHTIASMEVGLTVICTWLFLGDTLGSEGYLLLLICIAGYVLFDPAILEKKHLLLLSNCIVSNILYVYAESYLVYMQTPYIYIETEWLIPVLSIFFSASVGVFLLVISIFQFVRLKKLLLIIESKNSILQSRIEKDHLTQVASRSYTEQILSERYEECHKFGKKFCVVIADIDFFKKVNDTYGHDVGDLVLKDVAGILSSSVRENDLVGRWGGEEFLIILDADLSVAHIILERMRKKIEAHTIETSEGVISVTMTFGCVSVENSQQTIEELLSDADKLLYKGKKNGRNQVVE